MENKQEKVIHNYIVIGNENIESNNLYLMNALIDDRYTMLLQKNIFKT